jgi:hypothetical protein
MLPDRINLRATPVPKVEHAWGRSEIAGCRRSPVCPACRGLPQLCSRLSIARANAVPVASEAAPRPCSRLITAGANACRWHQCSRHGCAQGWARLGQVGQFPVVAGHGRLPGKKRSEMAAVAAQGGPKGSGPAEIASVGGADLDQVPVLHEQRRLNRQTRLADYGLLDVACRIAADPFRGIGDFERDG